MDYYTLLGLSKNAGKEEIKKSFKRYSLKLHPDKHNNDVFFNEMFLKIKEAYDVLSDEHKRNDYDNGINHNTRPNKSFEKENDDSDKKIIENLKQENYYLKKYLDEEKSKSRIISEKCAVLKDEVLSLETELITKKAELIQNSKYIHEINEILSEANDELGKIKTDLIKLQKKKFGPDNAGCLVMIVFFVFFVRLFF